MNRQLKRAELIIRLTAALAGAGVAVTHLIVVLSSVNW